MRRRSVILLCAFGLAVAAVGVAVAAFTSSTTTGGNTFSAASSFGCNAATYTPIWLTGFEEGVASNAGAGLYDVGANAGIDSAITRSGSYSLQLDATSGGSYVARAQGTNTGTLRFALRFDSLPTGDVTSLASFAVNAGSALVLGYRSSDDKLTLRWGTGTPAVSSSAITAGTWYVVDMRANLSANPRVGDWQLAGVSQSSVSAAEAASTISYVGLGSQAAAPFSANYDDVIATTTGADFPIGAGSVLALRPDGVGTHATPGNFTDDDGTAIDSGSWSRLDETPWTSTADNVRQTSPGAATYLAFSFADPSSTCIKAVAATVAYRSPGGAGGPNSGKTSIFDGATERVIYSGNMNNTALAYGGDGFGPVAASWTNAAVSALFVRVGYSGDVKPVPIWDAVQLNYETQ